MHQESNHHRQKQLFILVDKKEFKFATPFQKILGFCPMFNNTCVVLGIKSHRKQCLSHIDANGKILKQLLFEDSNLFPYAITSQKQILIVDNDQDYILQWNLQTYQKLQFPFKYKNQGCDSHQIFVFPDTKLICIAEWGRHDSNEFKLTYYQYPLTMDSQPVCQFEQNDTNVWNYGYTVRRANTHSMFVWFKSTLKQQIQVKTYQLKLNEQHKWVGEYKIHKIQNPIRNENSKSQLSIGNIWEMKKGNLCVIALTDRPHTENYVPSCVFIFETQNLIFRQAYFKFEGKYNFQIIDYYSFGSTSMLRTFEYNQGKPLPSPIYFMDNQSECIAARSTWTCNHLSKYTFPGYDRDMIIDAEYENGDVKKVVSKAIKAVQPKQIIVNLLQNYIKGIDEDLIFEVNKMLELRRAN